jgi:hypothetical protein
MHQRLKFFPGQYGMLPLLSLTLSSFCVADLDSHHVGKPLHQRGKPDEDQSEKPDPDHHHTSAKLWRLTVEPWWLTLEADNEAVYSVD